MITVRQGEESVMLANIKPYFLLYQVPRKLATSDQKKPILLKISWKFVSKAKMNLLLGVILPVGQDVVIVVVQVIGHFLLDIDRLAPLAELTE